MTIRLIPTSCFALAALFSGCQDTASRNPAEQIEHPTVIAYYFHRTVRCTTCLAIEANARRVIDEDFSQQVAEGRLIWIPYNLDEPDGKGIQEEFGVFGSTLVLSRVDGGNNTEYKKLEKVWDFIGDSVKFDNYVRTEVQQFLNE